MISLSQIYSFAELVEFQFKILYLSISDLTQILICIDKRQDGAAHRRE